jgi:hypothetical protein
LIGRGFCPATLTFLNLLVIDLTKAKFYDSMNAEEAIGSLAERPTAYNNPVEQIMFILGYKCDPKFDTFVHAIMHGANPGITSIIESTNIEAAIVGNLRWWATCVQRLQECGPPALSEIKDDIYQKIIEELDEAHYGGRWFEDTALPSDVWVNMGKYSPLFMRGSRVFCLPEPYFAIVAPIL